MPQIMAQNLRQRSSKSNLKKAISRGASINERSDGEHSVHVDLPSGRCHARCTGTFLQPRHGK